MKDDEYWKTEAKRIFRAELTRRGVTYERLAEALRNSGINETVPNIKNKVSRGKFDFIFLLKCMDAIGCRSISLDVH